MLGRRFIIQDSWGEELLKQRQEKNLILMDKGFWLFIIVTLCFFFIRYSLPTFALSSIITFWLIFIILSLNNYPFWISIGVFPLKIWSVYICIAGVLIALFWLDSSPFISDYVILEETLTCTYKSRCPGQIFDLHCNSPPAVDSRRSRRCGPQP